MSNSGCTLRIFRFLVVAVSAAGLTACQITPVQPWEKDILAQPAMQFDVSDMDMIMDEHFYFSKEGSSGGQGVSAGGCGCN